VTELELFTAALARTDPHDRAAFLDRVCEGKPELRRRVEELLAGHAREGNPLDRPPLDPDCLAATGDYCPAARTGTPGDTPAGGSGSAAPVGTVIGGRYTLDGVLGEGGMGTVYLATQTEPVRRQVALKLIKAGMDSKAVLARLEAERQAIALMDHPHIARLLDAGTTTAGQPFFVMELVKGVPITDFCDVQRLSVPDRLRLFAQVCAAVQHAHQKGVIHRDLKPSNVLVENRDGVPVPKVIDFGLAKATTGLPLTDRTLFTGFGSVMGTPCYMAPEQARFDAVDVDTRADIYALGVVLYELLTGTTPLTRETLKRVAMDEVLRLVREQEAPPPSSRLSTSDSPPGVAAVRQTEPMKLGRFVRGELDWVVLKALAKERDRRYETANGLARDVERFLAHEPVVAGPPTAGYRLRKFVRRNRPQVAAAALVLIALVAGIAGTAWQAARAERARADEATQRGIAEEREREATAQKENALAAAEKERTAREAEAAARAKEAEERRSADAIAGFVLDDLLGLIGAEGQTRFAGRFRWELKPLVTLRDLLDRAAARLDGRKDLAPRTEADLRWLVGVNYNARGAYREAVHHLERAAALRETALGPDHPRTLDATISLAVAYCAAGREADAIRLYERVRDARTRATGPDRPDTAIDLSDLGVAPANPARAAEAVRVLERVRIALLLVLGPDHPDVLVNLNDLGVAYWQLGRLDRAVPLFEETLRACDRRFGRGHPVTRLAAANLGVNYKAAGRLAEALPLLEEAFRATKEHPAVLSAGPPLLDVYVSAGNRQAAALVARELAAAARKRLAKDTPRLGDKLVQLSRPLLRAGAFADAEALLREALAIREKSQPMAVGRYNAMSLLGGALLGQERYAEAEPLLLEGYEGLKARTKVTEGDRLPEAIDRLVELCTATGRPDEAARWRAERAKYPFVATPVTR
jgi:serine/threonine protein kinase/tetratricopeptide (TPR) repeat protein